MKVIIIEDERPAADKLEILLKRYNNAIEVIGKAGNVTDGVALLESHGDDVELIFMDIQLTDGLSFEIFDELEVQKPVIFITAFDQYALKAFKANGIDYILKPITYDALKQSMIKFDNLRQSSSTPLHNAGLGSVLSQLTESNYKSRFMVKIGEHIHSITTEEIMLFYAEGRDAYIVNQDGRKYIIDHKLETLEELLNPSSFFRVNRSFIINIAAIKDVLIYSNSRLKITPLADLEKEIVVSREKVQAFKAWYDGVV